MWLTDKQLEDRCRRTLAKDNTKMHKVRGDDGRPYYYLYEIGADDSLPDEDYRYMNLDQLLQYCEELAS